ncbi:MAG TPA: tetratricopeptide repeat protein [Candidatus Limnocylindria bacterium]|nr:tetratricopeptide repeat protein [Candidatus Limnocylindria bacterium]
MSRPDVGAVAEAQRRGDHDEVLRLTEALLAERPGNDAAHELRARALLALGRLDEAERHAQDAVRLDPEEVRYRELLAQVLSAGGAHRDAAAEFGRLARNDPREATWTVAEAEERIGAAQPAMGVEAARRAVKLDPTNGRAQLALSQALARVGDARGAFQAATRAVELLPDEPAAREALADAHWLADQDAAAFREFRALADELDGADRARVVDKARTLYRQHAGWAGRLVAGIDPVFEAAFARGWLHVD